MHPRNKIRLMAGVEIDPTLEAVEQITESETISEEGTMSVSEVEPKASEQTSIMSDGFDEGDLVLYNNGVGVVVMADPKTDMIGVIPAGLINASAPEKNRAVEMVKPDSSTCRKPTREEIEAFKTSKDELEAVDDDMDISFNTTEAWDMKDAEKGGEKYSKEFKKDKEGKKKTKVKEGTLGSRIKEKRMSESTHNYAPGNQISHEDTERDPINVVSQDAKSWANSLDPKVVKTEYTQQVDNRGEESMTEENSKVKVPSGIKEALKQAISEFRKDAESQGNGHTAQENAQFMMDTADAFQKILDHLQEGTVMDIKHAQIFASTLMGPMLHKLPDNVWDYITNGGQKRSLKHYMNEVK